MQIPWNLKKIVAFSLRGDRTNLQLTHSLTSNNFECLSKFVKNLEYVIELGISVRGHIARADQRLAFGCRGLHDRRREHAGFVKRLGERERLHLVADQDWNNGSLA